MVRIQITRAAESYEEPYVGITFEALKIVYSEKEIFYIAQIRENLALKIKSENCIELGGLGVAEETPNKTNTLQRKLLLVEDGSVDVDALEEWCDENHIKLVVYRHGSNIPQFLII